MTNGYGAKEIAIYEGVMKLVGEGADLHLVKTADIAEAAGIGKGTLYNYFSSKEEIIAKTILYHLLKQLGKGFEQVNAAKGFAGKCQALFDFLACCGMSKQNTFQYLLFHSNQQELSQLAASAAGLMAQQREKIERLFMRLAVLGSEEGLFPRPSDSEYVCQAFGSALMGYFQLFCYPCGTQPDPRDIERAKRNAYRLLCKALG